MNLFRRLFGKRPETFPGQKDRDWRSLVTQDVNRVPGDDIGRRRAVRSRLPVVLTILFFAALGGLLWYVVDEGAGVPAVAEGGLRFKTDGLLGPEVVRKALEAHPEGAARDVRSIKAELQKDNQVLVADVSRGPDGVLNVRLTERKAVARLVVTPPTGPMLVRLMDPSGVTFAGTGYPAAAVRGLPEIVNYRSTGSGDAMVVEGAEIAGPFLATAMSERYRAFYNQWAALSLADCFGEHEEAPGSALRVLLRPGSQPADRPALAEIVFSTARWREEFGYLKGLDLEALLRRPDATATAYVLKLSILNRTGPKPVPEPRLVPVAR
jgi:hypothetical protein